MTIRERIVADLTSAMKAKDAARLGVLRMLKAKIMEAEVEQRSVKGSDYVLDDRGCLAAISTYAKQRRDSIEAFRKGGKDDLATKEEAELKVLQEYLPAQLSDDELRRIVAVAIAEAGATSAKDMGAVMKIVMPKVEGQADGAVVSRMVRQGLA